MMDTRKVSKVGKEWYAGRLASLLAGSWLSTVFDVQTSGNAGLLGVEEMRAWFSWPRSAWMSERIGNCAFLIEKMFLPLARG